MKNIKTTLHLVIITILSILTFSPDQGQSVQAETDQFSCTNVTEIPQIECEALVAIYNPDTNQPYGWLETTTPCSWSSITCEDDHVTELYLYSNDLSSVPSEIGNLNNLAILYLFSNQLSSLPTEIGSLNNLTSLYLDSNQLSTLPTEIGNLNSLTYLSLGSNDLSSLPIEIGNLNNLIFLYLDSNQLSNLPASFINLVNLNNLDIKYNHLIDISTELRTFLDEKDPDWAESQTDLPTATPTPTNTSTNTPVPPTATFTSSPTHTSTPTLTPTSTPLPTATSTATPSPTYTPTPILAPEDDYESDNDCADAKKIKLDSFSQTHTFHSPTDIDWSTFTAPTAGIYRIEITIPKNSQADVDLYYYTACDGFHQEQFVETFTPGARLDVEADYDGQQFYIRLKNFKALQFGADVTYSLSVRRMPSERDNDGATLIPGPAIVVAGRDRGVDTAQDNIDQTALNAYDLFASKGREDSEIFFLTTDSSLPNVDGDSTERNLEYGITTWAREQLEKAGVAQVLTLYLVDHGGPDEFYLDRLNQEILTPNDLDEWLTTLEDDFPDLWVNVIIEACRAGSFIERKDGSISKPGRVIITSSNESYDAYVSRYGARFSDNFLTFLRQERNLAYSFQESSNIVQRFHSNQEPWIDADGDGIHNEPNDFSLASIRGFAEAGTLGSSWPPYIANVQPIAPSQAARFQAEVRHEYGNDAIQAVWAVVYPPDYTPPTGEAAYEDDGQLNSERLALIEFSPIEGTNGQFISDAYAEFTQSGLYRLVVYAQDQEGLQAQPVTISIDTTHQIFLPTVMR